MPSVLAPRKVTNMGQYTSVGTGSQNLARKFPHPKYFGRNFGDLNKLQKKSPRFSNRLETCAHKTFKLETLLRKLQN